jgi:large subunit ribosomal protein L29
MKPSKLREMSKEDLIQEEAALREQVFKLRFQTATGQLGSGSKVRGVRRDIARIRTILREMERKEQ